MWPSGESAGSDTESGNFVNCTHCERSGGCVELRHSRAPPIVTVAKTVAAIAASLKLDRLAFEGTTATCSGERRSVDSSLANPRCSLCAFSALGQLAHGTNEAITAFGNRFDKRGILAQGLP